MKPSLIPPHPGREPRAFTLIEMLLVVAIIGILISVAVPFMFGAISASRMASAGSSIAGMFSAAQQIASSEGCTVEVRIYRSPREGGIDSSARYHTVALFRHYETGEASPDPNPSASGRPLPAPLSLVLGDVLTLPDTLVITATPAASSLIDGLPDNNATARATKIIKNGVFADYQVPYEGATYKSFTFRSDATSLDSTRRWFLTLVDAVDEESGRGPANWKNFYCVQVDPLSGRVSTYRP